METLLHIGWCNAIGAACLAIPVALVARFYRRPALAHSLWLLVLLKFITPPVLSVSLPWPAAWDGESAEVAPTSPVPMEAQGRDPEPEVPATPQDFEPIDPSSSAEEAPALTLLPLPVASSEEAKELAAPLDTQPADHPAIAYPFSWQAFLAGFWLAGSVAWFLLAGYRLYRFQRLLRYTWLAPPDIQAQAQQVAGLLGLARSPGVWLVPAAISPMLWCWIGAPRLLVPSLLWERLAEEERATLLAHELVHLRRRDHWVRFLEMLVTGLYWWHPVVWWARRSVRAAEEQCCDAGVVLALPVFASAYAKTLVETVDFLSRARPALPLAASGIGQAHFLKRRLTMIMRGTTAGQALNWAGFLVVLGLGALLLPLWPSWAQNAPSPANADEPAQAGTVADRAVIGQVADEPAQADAGRALIAQLAGAADQPAATTAPAADKPKHSEDLQAARDEVGILQAQLEVKRAEAAEVRTRIGIARRRLQRINVLAANKAVSSEEVENAKDEVELLEAQLTPKRAQIAEAELRLKQAHRRLESGSRYPEKLSNRTSATTSPNTVSAVRGRLAGAIEASGVPLGTGPANVAVGRSPAASSAIRGDGGAIAATSSGTSNRYPAGSAGNPISNDHEQRLRELEKKMDDLLKEMKALRRDLRPRRVPDGATESR